MINRIKTRVMKRIGAGFAAFVMTLGFGVFAAPDMALADTYFGCPQGNVCLYNWINTNLSGGIIIIPSEDIYAPSNHCEPTGNHHYTISGISGYDTASSLIVNENAGSTYIYNFFEWVGCNYSGRSIQVQGGSYHRIANLSTPPQGGNFNETIASINRTAI